MHLFNCLSCYNRQYEIGALVNICSPTRAPVCLPECNSFCTNHIALFNGPLEVKLTTDEGIFDVITDVIGDVS